MAVSKRNKLLYGLGFSSQGIKDGLFQLFLFFYFSQILGLEPIYAGSASVIALIFDAISDPLVGTLSDRWKGGKWGRRHPFMLLSALPLGLFIYILFTPPAGLDQLGLFAWLTFFSVMVRFSLTFFIVPGMSLGAELSSDYNERTTITSYRVMFSAFLSPFIILLGLILFFTPTAENSNGLFNEAAYSKFALLCGSLSALVILISTYGTKNVIPTLPQNKGDQSKFNFNEYIKTIGDAISMKSYTTLVSYLMIIYIGLGVGTVFTPYFSTFFFELSEKELGALPIAAALGGVLSFIVGPIMGRNLDKKKAVIISTYIFGIFFSLPFTLRLLNIFPENGDPLLLPIYFFTLAVAYSFLWVSISLSNSMMADVVDEHELMTKTRSEGFFFSTMSFAYKCTVGGGYFIAGILLDIIQLPGQDIPIEQIEPNTILGLGYIGGPILLVFYLSGILFIRKYPITKTSYNAIRSKLDDEN